MKKCLFATGLLCGAIMSSGLYAQAGKVNKDAQIKRLLILSVYFGKQNKLTERQEEKLKKILKHISPADLNGVEKQADCLESADYDAFSNELEGYKLEENKKPVKKLAEKKKVAEKKSLNEVKQKLEEKKKK